MFSERFSAKQRVNRKQHLRTRRISHSASSSDKPGNHWLHIWSASSGEKNYCIASKWS
jgi:hypothetical protein